MSADWNPRSKYNGRWGSSGSYGDRDDKSQNSSGPSSNPNSGYSRYRQPSGESQRKSNDLSSTNKSSLDDQQSRSSRPYENFVDSYRPYNNNRNSYSSTNPYPHSSSSNPYSYNPKKGGSSYTTGQDNNSGSSYYNYRNSGRSRSGGGSNSGLNSSSNYYNKKSNSSSHRPYFDRKGSQRWIRSADGASSSGSGAGAGSHQDDGEKSYRTNPVETSDHYYPQRDRRSSLISSTSSSFTPNNNSNSSSSNNNNQRRSDKFNNDHTFINERSISPLNSDPYSEPPAAKPSSSNTQGYVRKSRPSLIPSNFKDDDKNDEDDDDYELENALRESSAQAKSEGDNNNENEHRKDSKSEEKEESKPKEHHQEKSQSLKSEQEVKKEQEQELITAKLPLTLEHKEELDENEHSSKSESITRQSSEESHYDIEPIPSDETPNKEDDKDQSEVKKDEQKVEKKQDSVEINDEKVKNENNVLTESEKFKENEKSELEEINKEEESDSYDPEAGLGYSRDVTPQITSQVPTIQNQSKSEDHSEKTSQKTTQEKKSVEKTEEIKKVKEESKKPIVPRQTINSCIFPMQRAELRAWELKNHLKKDILDANPYLLKKPIKDLSEFPFYERNLLAHKQGFKLKVLEKLSVLKGYTFDHKISLWNEYNSRDEEWKERLESMDQQMKKLYPHLNEDSEQQEDQEMKVEQTQSSSSTRKRGGRYNGDTVRSEAEFLEILKNLEKEKESDPIFKAEALAATIPDMILNPVEKSAKMCDVNNLVLDKEEWAKRIHSDPIDTFTKQEHAAFCEAFLAHPKRFGRISAALGGLRTSEECVLHYYKTKKSLTDYKQLLASKKKRKGKGKGRNRGGKSKDATSTNTPNSNTPAAETPNESGDEKDLQLENFIPKEAVIGEDIYTDTGRRRRAAAPVFDSSKPKDTPANNTAEEQQQTSRDEIERKRSLEPTPGSGDNADEHPSTKAPQKKKPRVGRTKKKEEAKIVTPISENPIAAELANPNVPVAITSYWSVKDINYFGSLIAEYGTNWPLVASKVRSKTTTMCRNYYTKHADANGWRTIAEEADQKNRAYQIQHEQQQQQQQAQIPIFHQPAPGQPHPQPQHLYPQVIQQYQQQPQQELKKPPLGVFNSHGDLPSNVNVAKPVDQQQQQQTSGSMLPSVHNLTSNSIPTFGNPQPIAQAAPPLIISPKQESGIPSGRSNPFSITSLLNPSEERRAAPPPQPIPMSQNQHIPQPGQFTLPKVEEPVSIPQPQAQPQRTVSNGSTTNRSNVFSMLNSDDAPKPFNPLSTLIAAADGQSSIQPQPVYSAPPPPHSHRGLDILNPAPEPPKPQVPQSSSFKLPSNFNNILSGDPPNN